MQLSEYVTEAGKLKSDAVMGWVVLVSIKDDLILRRDMVDALNTHGFDGSVVPAGMRRNEAFRYAKAASLRKYHTTEAGIHYSMLLRDVSTSGVLVKQLVIERSDGAKSLDFTKAAEFRYVPGAGGTDPGSIEADSYSNVLSGFPQSVVEMADNYVGEFTTLAARAEGSLDYFKTRNVLHHLLRGTLSGLAMRRSVYYVPNRNSADLNNFVQLWSTFTGVNLQLIPMVDLQAHKDMVIEAFREQATSNYLNLIERAKAIIADKTAGKNPRPATVRKLVEEYKEMTLANKGHIDDLSIDISTIRSTSEAAKQAVMNASQAVMS